MFIFISVHFTAWLLYYSSQCRMFLFVCVIGQLLKMTLLKLFHSNLVIHISVFPNLAVPRDQDCCLPTHLQIQRKLTSLVIAQMVEKMNLSTRAWNSHPWSLGPLRSTRLGKKYVSWIIWGEEMTPFWVNTGHETCIVSCK